LPVDSDKEDSPYPYFGLRERRHREIRHDPLEPDKCNPATMMLGGMLTKLLNPPFSPKKRSGWVDWVTQATVPLGRTKLYPTMVSMARPYWLVL
jgi:hypothetical protein